MKCENQLLKSNGELDSDFNDTAKKWQNLYDCGVIHDSNQVSQMPADLNTGLLELFQIQGVQ